MLRKVLDEKPGIPEKPSSSPNFSGLHQHHREGQLTVFLEINQISKGFSLVKSLGTKNATPLKDGQTASGTGCQDKSTDDSPLKKSKWRRKRKPPSSVARDRVRRHWFWKQKKSAKNSHLNAQQQQTENTVLEEDSIHSKQDCSSAVCQVAKDRPSRMILIWLNPVVI